MYLLPRSFCDKILARVSSVFQIHIKILLVAGSLHDSSKPSSCVLIPTNTQLFCLRLRLRLHHPVSINTNTAASTIYQKRSQYQSIKNYAYHQSHVSKMQNIALTAAGFLLVACFTAIAVCVYLLPRFNGLTAPETAPETTVRSGGTGSGNSSRRHPRRRRRYISRRRSRSRSRGRSLHRNNSPRRAQPPPIDRPHTRVRQHTAR